MNGLTRTVAGNATGTGKNTHTKSTTAKGVRGRELKIDIRVEMVEKFRGVEYWVAIDDQRYDCDCDQDGFFPNYAQATANSKWDAIRQLIDQLEEEDE